MKTKEQVKEEMFAKFVEEYDSIILKQDRRDMWFLIDTEIDEREKEIENWDSYNWKELYDLIMEDFRFAND